MSISFSILFNSLSEKTLWKHTSNYYHLRLLWILLNWDFLGFLGNPIRRCNILWIDDGGGRRKMRYGKDLVGGARRWSPLLWARWQKMCKNKTIMREIEWKKDEEKPTESLCSFLFVLSCEAAKLPAQQILQHHNKVCGDCSILVCGARVQGGPGCASLQQNPQEILIPQTNIKVLGWAGIHCAVGQWQEFRDRESRNKHKQRGDELTASL